MKNEDELILDLAGCLPLAPPERFLEGIQIIESQIEFYDNHVHGKLEKFINYLRRTCYRNRYLICVGNLPHRTNNLNESLNHRLGKKLGGKHPGVWKFLCL